MQTHNYTESKSPTTKKQYESELGRYKTAIRNCSLEKETARSIQSRILELEKILQEQ